MLALKLGLSLVSSNAGGAAGTFFLDEYSGAAVAYSLRKLSSSTTNVIRVRESGANAEQDFSSSEITDGTLTTFTGSNDGFVTTWYDQSGSDNNAVQTTAINQPKIVSSGVVELENGLPALNFDGINDNLDITSANVGSTFFVSLVYRSNRTSSEDYIVVGDGLASRIRLYSTQIRTYINSATYTFAATSGFGVQYIYQFESDDSKAYITYRNSVALGVAKTIPSTDSFIVDNIGYGTTVRAANGLMQEIILYATEQNANRVGMTTDVNNFYSIY